MVCEIEAKFVQTYNIVEGWTFENLVNSIKEIYKKGHKLTWKPEKVEINGTTVGFLLYFTHDC